MTDRYDGGDNSQLRRQLEVHVAGGGPVGLAFALSVSHLMGPEASIRVWDPRWRTVGEALNWRSEKEGNSRRQQVVTLQSQVYRLLPPRVQAVLFRTNAFSEMWPYGPDSPPAVGRPRNVRIAHAEDVLLELANKTRNIRLEQGRYDPGQLRNCHILAIADGVQSPTRTHFGNHFRTDNLAYSLDGKEPLTDVVLGLRVKSDLSDLASVLLTVAQNRYLLNSLNGEGFLNVRLTPAEVAEVVGIDRHEERAVECIQSQPCLMQKDARGRFTCARHNAVFKPATDPDSFLWQRIKDGLQLFGVKEQNLTAVTAFRLNMVQRARFNAELLPATDTSPAAFGCLIGDAAIGIHFWPGRGLNSGLVSAISLARCLNRHWNGRSLRAADLNRHHGVMAMLQDRHQNRAWRAMVAPQPDGTHVAIHSIHDQATRAVRMADKAAPSTADDLEALMTRIRTTSARLAGRVGDLSSAPENLLRRQFARVRPQTLRVMVAGGPWDTRNVGGDEVDLDSILPESAQVAAARTTTQPANPGAPRANRARVAVVLAIILLLLLGTATHLRPLNF